PAQRGPGREPPAVPLRRPHQAGLRERDLRRARARSRRRQARHRRRRARGGPVPSGAGDHRDARRPDRTAGACAGGQRAAEVLRARPTDAARRGPRPLGHRRARQRERRRGGRGPRRRGARTPAALGRVARRQAGRLRSPAQSRRPHHDRFVHAAVPHRARRPDPHRVRAGRRRRGGVPVKRGGLLLLPIALGTVLVAEGINGFYGPKGWLNQGLQAAGLGDPPRLTHNYTGVMIALFVQHFPFCFLMLLGYISGIDPALEASARVLGARPWVVFRRVMWPLIAPGAAIAFPLGRWAAGRGAPVPGAAYWRSLLASRAAPTPGRRRHRDRGQTLMRGRVWRLAVFLFVLGFTLNLVGIVSHVVVSSLAKR